MIKKLNGKKWIAIMMCMMMVTGLSACGSEEQKDDYLIVQGDVEPYVYSTVTVAKGDVSKTVRVRCTYLQTKDEEVAFDVSGKRVEKVYVKVGDAVKKGQVLAELSGGGVQNDIDKLEYQISKNTILLNQTLDNKQYELDRCEKDYELWSKKDLHNQIDHEKDLEKIEENYRYSIEDLNDSISLDTRELEKLKKDQKNSNLYAGMDGTISSVVDNLEGSTCTKDKVVIKIIDSSDCLFAASDASYADCFKEGEAVSLNISTGTGVGDYDVYPFEMSKWTDTMYFSLANKEEKAAIDVGTDGMIRMTLDEKTDVLTIPLKAVHKADEKAYVYVEGENGVREVKWISAGLFGDDTVEVVDGLSEGDTVIVR